jgi:hypothetical protein
MLIFFGARLYDTGRLSLASAVFLLLIVAVCGSLAGTLM